MPPRTVSDSLKQLRDDAKARGMSDLALTYSLSVLRLIADEIEARIKALLDKYKGR